MRGISVLDERFWSKVNKTESCWLWTGAKAEYGKFWLDGKTVSAHRLVYESIHGAVPDGMMVCHHCDNPLCVNPNHLFLGTASDNIEDMIQKGRQGYTGQRGVKNPKVKLHPYQVREIRIKARQGQSSSRLAKQYGVNKSTINRIINGDLWSHVR